MCGAGNPLNITETPYDAKMAAWRDAFLSHCSAAIDKYIAKEKSSRLPAKPGALLASQWSCVHVDLFDRSDPENRKREASAK